MTDTENWLDIIPAIRFTSPTPCVLLGDSAVVAQMKKGIAVETIDPDGDTPEVCVVAYPTSYTSEADVVLVPDDEVRADLDDDMGFVYALRHLYNNGDKEVDLDVYFDECAEKRGHVDMWADERGLLKGDDLLMALLLGKEKPTDADRLALARALVELVSA
mgnify:CR=1 FL=1